MCEFGCFRGVLSVKLAWMMKAIGARRHYYAFDTFEGFAIDDPEGGALESAPSRTCHSYRFLTQWSRVLR